MNKPLAKSLHTHSVLVNLAKNLIAVRHSTTAQGAIDAAMAMLGLTGKEDPHGLVQRALEALTPKAEAMAPTAQPVTPKDLERAGYRIEFGTYERGDHPDLVGRYWWTWSEGSGLDTSDGDWPTAGEAIADARSDKGDDQPEPRETPEDTPSLANCDDAGTGEGAYHGRM